jgi:hypothetical protein
MNLLRAYCKNPRVNQCFNSNPLKGDSMPGIRKTVMQNMLLHQANSLWSFSGRFAISTRYEVILEPRLYPCSCHSHSHYDNLCSLSSWKHPMKHINCVNIFRKHHKRIFFGYLVFSNIWCFHDAPENTGFDLNNDTGMLYTWIVFVT